MSSGCFKHGLYRHFPELPRSVSQGGCPQHSLSSTRPFPFPFPRLLKQSGERIVVNLQLLSAIVVEMCFYVSWGRFALGSLKKLAGMQRGKKYSYEFVGFK